jgi:hypothetical protein
MAMPNNAFFMVPHFWNVTVEPSKLTLSEDCTSSSGGFFGGVESVEAAGENAEQRHEV